MSSSVIAISDINFDSIPEILFAGSVLLIALIKQEGKTLFVCSRTATYRSIEWNCTSPLDLRQESSLGLGDAFISSMLVADANGDGYKDIVLSADKKLPNNTYRSAILLLLNDKKGRFTPQKYEFDNSGIQLVAAIDVNNDKHADLLYVSNNKLFILKKDEDDYKSLFVYYGKLDIINRANSYPFEFHIYAMDINGDGYQDIILPNVHNHSIGFLQNRGNEYWNFLHNQGENDTETEAQEMNPEWEYIELFKLDPKLQFSDFVMVHIDYKFNFACLYKNELIWYTPMTSTVPIQEAEFETIRISVPGNRSSSNFKSLSDIDLFDDGTMSLMILQEDGSLFLMRRLEPYLKGFGWNTNFWIIVIVYTFVLSLLLGILHFHGLSKSTSNNDIPSLLLSRQAFETKQQWDMDRLSAISPGQRSQRHSL